MRTGLFFHRNLESFDASQQQIYSQFTIKPQDWTTPPTPKQSRHSFNFTVLLILVQPINRFHDSCWALHISLDVKTLMQIQIFLTKVLYYFKCICLFDLTFSLFCRFGTTVSYLRAFSVFSNQKMCVRTAHLWETAICSLWQFSEPHHSSLIAPSNNYWVVFALWYLPALSTC